MFIYIRSVCISPYWQQTEPVRSVSYTNQINWFVPVSRTPRIKLAGQRGPSFKRISILIKIQYNQIKFNTERVTFCFSCNEKNRMTRVRDCMVETNCEKKKVLACYNDNG